MSLSSLYATAPAAKRLKTYTSNLFKLATEILGYTKLTKEFHEPICRWWMNNEDEDFVLFMAARQHYKTTIQIADMARCILKNPDSTQLVLHAVEDEAQKIVEECGTHFLKNKEFRALRPEIMPSMQAKRFLTASSFTITRGRTNYDRQATVTGKAVGSEITGMHVNTCIRLDDIVGRNTIADNQLPNVKAFVRNTVMPVRMPGCKIRATGTHWDINDPYMDWRKSKNWISMVRAAIETGEYPNHTIDPKGKPVLMSPKEIRLARETMGPDFDFQMMNDPSPSGEKPWDQRTCETYCELKDVLPNAYRVVLSDPAPAKVGAWSLDKKRYDGGKDEWATITVAFQSRGQRREIILLDGAASREWEPSIGWLELCRQKRRWQTANCAIEKVGQATAYYMEDLKRVSREEGVKHHELELTIAGHRGKNVLFGSLADRAKQGEVLICKDTVPAGFLEGLLDQCREWRALDNGKNSLPYDDRANVLSFACDPVFKRYTADPMVVKPTWDPFAGARGESQPTHGGRYIRY